MAKLDDMADAILEKRRRGRPPKAEAERLGPGKFVRFSLVDEAAIELARQAKERDELRKVETSEVVRDLCHEALEARRASRRPARHSKKPA